MSQTEWLLMEFVYESMMFNDGESNKIDREKEESFDIQEEEKKWLSIFRQTHFFMFYAIIFEWDWFYGGGD